MKFLLDIVRHNVMKKIIALIAAFFMWVFVMDKQDPQIEKYYDVPLTLSNAPFELTPICEEKMIRLKLRAQRSNFFKYDSSAFRVYINLEGMDAGEYKLVPRPVPPMGFEVLEMMPSNVHVKLDPLIEKSMPIEIETMGTIAPNAIIKKIDKSIDTVTVVGPKSAVECTQRVFGTVKLLNNSSSFEVQVPLTAVDENQNAIPRVHVVPSVITVTVNVESGIKKRIVPVVPEVSAAEGYELSKVVSNPTQVEVVGAESIVNSIITLKTEPLIIPEGQSTYSGTLNLEVPEGVSVDHNEVTISAIITKKATTSNDNAGEE
ncbi:MAG: hypothetical protein K6G55_07865 [Selenomonadaceae bacterium]|nr:hypothetical protein [Selenomonadaceae bacterium]